MTHHNVQSAGLALVQIATGAPMLPLSCLFAGSLLPHVVSMVETPRVRSVLLQREVLVRVWKKDLLQGGFVSRRAGMSWERRAIFHVTYADYSPRRDSGNPWLLYSAPSTWIPVCKDNNPPETPNRRNTVPLRSAREESNRSSVRRKFIIIPLDFSLINILALSIANELFYSLIVEISSFKHYSNNSWYGVNLIFLGQRLWMLHQVTQGHWTPIVRAFSLQRILFDFVAEWMYRLAPKMLKGL